MNIFNFDQEDSLPSSSSFSHGEEPLPPHHHLDPAQVLALASSLPNCRRILPPRIHSPPLSPPPSTSSAESSGVFSSFRRRWQRRFAADDDRPDVLSFLATDPPNEVARIDVYCRTGTACTLRVVPSLLDSSSPSLLSTPRHTNVRSDGLAPMDCVLSSSSSYSPSRSQSRALYVDTRLDDVEMDPDLGVRRIFRRKLTLEGLRRLLRHPPSLSEISVDVVPPSPPVEEGRVRPRPKFQLSGLSEPQRRFLHRERRKYARRLRREERVRRRLSEMVLAGNDGGESDREGDSCDASGKSWGTAEEESADGDSVGASAEREESDEAVANARKRQREIRRMIALADVALAILAGEVESVERMMGLLQKERGGEESSGEDSGKERTNHHPREGRRSRDKKERGREGKEHRCRPGVLSVRGTSSSRSRSVSVASSRQRKDSFSTLEDGSVSNDTSSSSSSSSSSASLDDSEAEEIARMLQGCEVEYSFPYDFHEELEDALLAQEFASDARESYSSGVDTDGDSTSRGPVFRRGRTRYREDAGPKRRREIPTIVAVPTNGQGCIVLRNNGAFSVVGNLPKPLYKQLFRKSGPFPEYIALGTRGRYYVRFEDGTFKFVGPSSLKSCLNESGAHDSAKAKRGSRFFKNHVRTKGEIDHRLQHPLAIASLAFGKKYDDFFVVRNDGSWECNGDMPRSLEKLLQDRRGRGDLQWVSLGPNQEWCVKANNGRIWWGGVSKEVDEHLSGILIEDDENASGFCHDLKFIDFGADDSFFLLHR